MDIKIEEVENAFLSAKNLNAALKNLLKREGRNESVGPFVKSFRSVAATGKSDAIREFVATHYEKRKPHFMATAQLAYSEVFDSIVQKVFATHAEKFNTTYEKVEGGIEVKDAAAFGVIVKDVSRIVDDELKNAQLSGNSFLKSAVLSAVFDAEVLPDVIKHL